jgi:hypothetical protein
MTYTNPITLELLMRERMSDRLQEAERERTVDVARRAARRAHLPRLAVTAVVAFARLLSVVI